ILIIDDQNSIHEVFRTVLLRPSLNDGALNDLEASLFGDMPAAGNDKTFTEHIPHLVEFAHQGEEGCQKLRAAHERGDHFDLAFVDMQMPPGWNGIETIKQLWSLAPSLHVVICTAYSEYSWIDICRMLGKIDQLNLLPKPFLAAEVHELLGRVVHGSEQVTRDMVF
ncbi:MAG: response regulator, partial [Planctomycetaceae bacterium]